MMLFFISPNFVNTDFMTSPFKWCIEPGINERKNNILRQKAGAEDQHIGIVMASGKARLLDILAERCANSIHFIGRDRAPDPGVADPDRAVALLARHFFGRGKNEIRVVAGLVGESAAIHHLEILVLEKIDQCFFELNAAMIGRDSDLGLHHDFRL